MFHCFTVDTAIHVIFAPPPQLRHYVLFLSNWCAQYLEKYWIDFYQIYCADAFWDRDVCFRVGGQKRARSLWNTICWKQYFVGGGLRYWYSVSCTKFRVSSVSCTLIHSLSIIAALLITTVRSLYNMNCLPFSSWLLMVLFHADAKRCISRVSTTPGNTGNLLEF